MPDSIPSAAVAIIKLTVLSEQEHYLVLRRAAQPEDPWSGHFSFPGGRQENGDRDLFSTCLRETEEETGLRLSPDQLELRLPVEPAGRHFNAPIWVQPFLFSISSPPTLNLDSNEIQSYIWLNARHLRNPANHQQVEMLPGRFFPAYPIEDYFLWGFTYRLLMSILTSDNRL